MKDKNGVELVVGDEFVSKNGLTWKITEFKDYAFAICEEKNWDGFYDSGEITKRQVVLDFRGREINVGDHVWSIDAKMEYIVTDLHDDFLRVNINDVCSSYVPPPNRVVVLT